MSTTFPMTFPGFNRGITPGQFFLESCDGKFTDDDLNEEGNAFAQKYFDLDGGQFLADYEETVGADVPSLYHVPDTWQTFDRLRPILDGRLSAWRANR